MKPLPGFWRAAIVLGIFLLATVLAYLPGLQGGFVYDDSTSITGNSNIQIKNGTLSEWATAALSFPSGTPPFRSLTMLSFAGNYFVSGLDPFGFKLTNLCIHALNGLLLFMALRALFELRRECAREAGVPVSFDGDLAAASIAGLWLLLPINLTAVLYSVQRLESLAATFVFLGLWWYLRARLRVWQGRGGSVGLWLSIALCTGLGLLAKETAVMLPLYAVLIEFCVTEGRNRDRTFSRPVLSLYTVTLLLPFLVGLFWMWGRYIGPSAGGGRAFPLARLLTESRIMIDYMTWTIVPSLDSLTLYHDDISLSNSLFDPPTTIASLAALAILIGAALWQRRRRPLFSLGVLWFFAGHLLTGTVFPLILAFEHRNYFSSAGLLLAVASLVALEGGLKRRQTRAAVVIAAALLYASTTWMRATEWSDPLRLATGDALKRPSSPAAQFDYAMALLHVARNSNSGEAIDAALKVLDAKRTLPGASVMYEQNIISILSPSGYDVPAAVWTSLVGKLKERPATTNDSRALSQLNNCFISEKCKQSELPHLAEAYDAAMAHPRPLPVLLSVHAEYAWYLAHDHDLAEKQIREAARLSPRDLQGQMQLIVVLIHQGKRSEAEAMIESIERRNYLGLLDGFLAPLRKTLASTQSSTSGS